MDDPMKKVRDEHAELERVREVAKAMVDKQRARLGLSMIEARADSKESQSTIGTAFGWHGTQQVRSYEQAYREWVEKHPDETLEI